jgi:hypothetical protein
LIGEYFNNVAIDTLLASVPPFRTPTATGPVSVALSAEIVLGKGGFIQGAASLSGKPAPWSIRWELYRLADLQNSANANPSPISSGNVDENTGAYTTSISCRLGMTPTLKPRGAEL